MKTLLLVAGLLLVMGWIAWVWLGDLFGPDDD